MLLNRDLIKVIIVFIIIQSVVCRKESVFVDLFQRGKSLFSRSFHFREGDRQGVTNSPEHRGGHYYGIELFDKPDSNNDHAGYSQEDQNDQLNEPKQPDHIDKEKSDYNKVIYHTDVIENDNMDLYKLIGGISFASLLATTIFVLGRNRRIGAFTKSFEDVSQSRGRRDAQNTVLYSMYPSEEDILARLLSSQLKLSLQKF